jgi:hypothetical protein
MLLAFGLVPGQERCSMLKADVGGLQAGSSGLATASAEAQDAATKLRDAAAQVGGGCGGSPVGPAVDRFVAAWGGELVACALGSAQLAKVAEENGRQMTAATGG